MTGTHSLLSAENTELSLGDVEDGEVCGGLHGQ
jgi:hypothetical protein